MTGGKRERRGRGRKIKMGERVKGKRRVGVVMEEGGREGERKGG